MQNTNDDNLGSQTEAEAAEITTRLNKLNEDPSIPTDGLATTPVLAVTDAGTTTLSAKNFIKEEKRSGKSRKVLIISGVIAFGAVVVALVYYFVIRVPEVEYQKASSIIDAMTTNTKKMAELGKKFSDITELTSSNIDEENGELMEYKTKLNQLKDSVVLQKDGEVKAAYEVNKQRIEDYATSTTTWIGTAGVYANLYQKCSSAFTSIESVTTVLEYDFRVKECSDYASSHQTVPDKNFNDNFYVPYRDGTLDYIRSVREYVQVLSDNNQNAYDKALKQIEAAHNELVDAGIGKNVKLTNTLNPTDQLINLRSTIEKRKSVLLR